MYDSAHRPRHTIPSFGSWFPSLLATLGIALVGMNAGAQEPSKAAIQSLDEQVQEIKTDILAIAAELNSLEEKLLYPSNSQLAIFVSLEEGDSLGLDSVQVSIDGELVAHHIYSFKELQALQKGGVQRIYTGNVRTGEHQLEVSIAARNAGGKDIGHRQSFAFSKQVDPKLVGITLASGTTGDATIAVGGW
jgi:hypothetical protein